LLHILTTPPAATLDSQVFVLVGINGSGKTTFAGKLAHKLKQEGNNVLLVAADTFRAAAPEQLTAWAQNIGVDIVLGTPNQDPAAVVFAGCERFKKENYDAIIIDTAGRLHTKTNLMNELAKIKRVITKQLPDKSITTLLTIDAMLGQNSFEQAKLFKECTDVNGIVLTKMDGTGKGGIVFAIAHQLHIPIAYISFGEQLDNIKLFDAQEYVHDLLEV
jgi:fused signal recognition particle receptor